MGLKSWWNASRARAEANRRTVAINEDQNLIAAQVPELAGMSSVDGMAYTMQAIQEWNGYCSPEQATEFSQRLLASNQAWAADGMTMPYWGNLWVLRRYQAELGLDVPSVAEPVRGE